MALLAGGARGLYTSVPEACDAVIKTDRIQSPIPENTAKYAPYYRLYTELYPAMKASLPSWENCRRKPETARGHFARGRFCHVLLSQNILTFIPIKVIV